MQGLRPIVMHHCHWLAAEKVKMGTPTRIVRILKQLPRPAMEAALAEPFFSGHYLQLLLIYQGFPLVKSLKQ